MSAANKVRAAATYSKALALGRIRGYEVPEVPRLVPEALEYFRSRVVDGVLYVEYGSGGSTVLAARVGASVISVESDRYYLRSVARKVAETAPDARTDLIHADIGMTREWGRPVLTRPSADRVAAWARYLEAPWSRPQVQHRKPDVVLVDGRFRVATALTCLKHLGDGGSEILFDDCGDRPHYRAVEDFMPVVRMLGRMAVFEPVPVEAHALALAIGEWKVDWR